MITGFHHQNSYFQCVNKQSAEVITKFTNFKIATVCVPSQNQFHDFISKIY